MNTIETSQKKKMGEKDGSTINKKSSSNYRSNIFY